MAGFATVTEDTYTEIKDSLIEGYRNGLGPVARIRTEPSPRPIESVATRYPLGTRGVNSTSHRPACLRVGGRVADQTHLAIFRGRAPEDERPGLLTHPEVEAWNTSDPVDPSADRILEDVLTQAWFSGTSRASDGPVVAVKNRALLKRNKLYGATRREALLDQSLGGFDIVNLSWLDSSELYLVDPAAVSVVVDHDGTLRTPTVSEPYLHQRQKTVLAETAVKGRLEHPGAVQRIRLDR